MQNSDCRELGGWRGDCRITDIPGGTLQDHPRHDNRPVRESESRRRSGHRRGQISQDTRLPDQVVVELTRDTTLESVDSWTSPLVCSSSTVSLAWMADD